MKRFLMSVAVLLALGCALAVIRRVSANEARNNPQNGQTVRVVRRDVGSTVKAVGVIKPMVGAEVRVGSSVSGVVTRLLVRVGDKVEKGTLLADVDARQIMARCDAAEAAVKLASANLNYALTDLRRKQELNAAQIIARSELDLAQQAHSVADQQYQQAQANLADIKTQLGYAKIVAPITGTVESVSTQEGETVASSFASPTFVTLLDLSRLEVWAYVDETDIGRIHVGQRAVFTVDTYGDHEFSGEVTAIYPQAQIRENVVDYVAVVRFRPPHDRVLRPDMTTTVKIALQQHQSVLSLPIRAVRREGTQRFVMVRNGSQIERRFIATGIQDEGYWEVTSGLRENDQVVVSDIDKPER
jgi:RND family efflux transporter MFP subunit